jgi:hypothetical protein
MKLSLKNTFDAWKRNNKIQREQPEVWLLKDLNVGYIQIPKVATRSIQQCLASYYVKKECVGGPLIWDKKEIKKIEKKTAFHASQKKLNLLAKNNYIFAFVRNPYDRLYSAYKNKVIQPLEIGGKNIFRNHGVRLGMKFDDFVDIVCRVPDNKIDRHLRSQSWFLSYEGKVIPKFIGHLESFDKDWAELNKRFNLGDPIHKNSTKSLNVEDYREKYSSELEEKVFKRYKEDFTFFGYKRLNTK